MGHENKANRMFLIRAYLTDFQFLLDACTHFHVVSCWDYQIFKNFKCSTESLLHDDIQLWTFQYKIPSVFADIVREIFFLYSQEDQTVCDSDQLISNKKTSFFLCVRFHQTRPRTDRDQEYGILQRVIAHRGRLLIEDEFN